MKASVSPTGAILAIVIFSCTVLVANAQDAVVQKDGQRRDGQITGVKGDVLRIKIGPAETGIPLANVSSVTMAPPKAYADTLAAWQAGDAKKTLLLLEPLVASFNGLPTVWAERASALLGEAFLTSGQVGKAEAAFASFQKSYPASASTADIGLARLAIEKKDFATAQAKLLPVAEKAKATKLAGAGENAVFGQALTLLGQVQESSAENSEALENYLLVTTIFHEDDAAAKKSRERADALIEKSVIVP